MTAIPAARHLPESADAVEVYGSKFLLEWLDLEVLACAAARLLEDRPVQPVAPQSA